MRTTDYTIDAQEMLGEFVIKAGKTFLTVRVADVFGDETTVKITPANLAEFYATQANNLTSGIRTLAGLHGDWRPISQLADLALDWFKQVNIEGMRRAAQRVGLTPKFKIPESVGLYLCWLKSPITSTGNERCQSQKCP